jgi:predicted nuclease with TOPRIM domain
MVMENESSAARLREKLTELSNEYSKEKQIHSRSRSANSRAPISDPNASLRYRRMRRKVDVLRTQIDAALHDDYLTTTESNNTAKDMIPTRDDDVPLKKKNDEQNLVTTELIQVLHSKQTKINELEQQLKDIEQQASQWKTKYQRECHRRELLEQKLIELEKELQNRQRQSVLLVQLQTDVERLHQAFNALEAENAQLNSQLSLVRNTRPVSARLSSQLDKFRHELSQTCHESLC